MATFPNLSRQVLNHYEIRALELEGGPDNTHFIVDFSDKIILPKKRTQKEPTQRQMSISGMAETN